MKALPTFLLTSLGLLAFAATPSAEAKQPNVLFLIVDDLNCRIGSYGDPIAKTPNIDRLASKGVRFDRAYCNFPVCNPSRSSVMSGRYPTTTGVVGNTTWLILEDGHPTLNQHFEQQGYSAALIGKIYHAPNTGFADASETPEVKGRLTWATPAERAQQQAANPDFWKTNFDHYRTDPPPEDEIKLLTEWHNVFGPVPVGKDTPDIVFADRAIKQLEGWKGDAQPFFLAVGFLKPHVPLLAPQPYFDEYTAEELALPPDFANEPTGPAGTPPDELRRNMDLYASGNFSAADARAALEAYYACITYVDAQIGRVLDALEASGEADNTIIVLWGDHGWHLSDKGMWGKGTLFESAARAPLIIADPRQKASAGKTSRRIVQFVDIYPTLADLCGVPIPKGLDGVSLKPLLDNPDATWDHPAFTVQTRAWFIGRRIRTERWAYSEWDEGRRGAMLFDHDQDPHEMHNLISDPKHQGIAQQLQSQLRQSKVGQSMRRN